MKRTLDFVRGRLEEMKTWPKEKIEENRMEVDAMTKSWRDLSDEKSIFLIDTGSPLGRDDLGSGRLIKVDTPYPANQVSVITDKQTNQELVNAAISNGWETERPAENPPEESYSEAFQSSLRKPGEPEQTEQTT